MDRNRFEIFERCKKNNEAYFECIKFKEMHIMISKFPYTGFGLRIYNPIDRDNTIFYNDHLGPFDAADLVKEYVTNYKNTHKV